MKDNSFNNMTKTQKLAWFWDYYHWFVLGGIAVVAFISILLFQILRMPKETIVEITLTNADSQAAAENTFFDEFLSENGYDSDFDTIDVDTSLDIDTDSGDYISSTALQILDAEILSGSVDIISGSEGLFDLLAQSNTFLDLRDILTDDELKELSDSLYSCKNEDGDLIPIGIRLNDQAGLGAENLVEDGSIVGITASSERKDEAIIMLEYMINH